MKFVILICKINDYIKTLTAGCLSSNVMIFLWLISPVSGFSKTFDNMCTTAQESIIFYGIDYYDNNTHFFGNYKIYSHLEIPSQLDNVIESEKESDNEKKYFPIAPIIEKNKDRLIDVFESFFDYQPSFNELKTNYRLSNYSSSNLSLSLLFDHILDFRTGKKHRKKLTILLRKNDVNGCNGDTIACGDLGVLSEKEIYGLNFENVIKVFLTKAPLYSKSDCIMLSHDFNANNLVKEIKIYQNNDLQKILKFEDGINPNEIEKSIRNNYPELIGVLDLEIIWSDGASLNKKIKLIPRA